MTMNDKIELPDGMKELAIVMRKQDVIKQCIANNKVTFIQIEFSNGTNIGMCREQMIKVEKQVNDLLNAIVNGQDRYIKYLTDKYINN